MARHSVKDLLQATIDLLNAPKAFDYLNEPIRFYAREIQEMIESGTIIDGPRLWVYYAGSSFPRTELDNAYVYNESPTIAVICYDNNYAGSEDAASGESYGSHPGTYLMIEDVKNRLYGIRPFSDAMPFIPDDIAPVNGLPRTMSAYTVPVRTEFDYGTAT